MYWSLGADGVGGADIAAGAGEGLEAAGAAGLGIGAEGTGADAGFCGGLGAGAGVGFEMGGGGVGAGEGIAGGSGDMLGLSLTTFFFSFLAGFLTFPSVTGAGAGSG
ncbi:MAG: hypothetical protein QCI38_05895 [Candidatus Thermoplasmatota archaeon]|nr:hypothetical protein [Candidatus Thermoplasmatota archaeon]